MRAALRACCCSKVLGPLILVKCFCECKRHMWGLCHVSSTIVALAYLTTVSQSFDCAFIVVGIKGFVPLFNRFRTAKGPKPLRPVL